MKSFAKVALMLVMTMPAFAGDMTTTANGSMNGNGNGMMDCSKMMGADKDKCMADMANMKKCMDMTDMAAKDKCMADMKAAGAAKMNGNGMMNQAQ